MDMDKILKKLNPLFQELMLFLQKSGKKFLQVSTPFWDLFVIFFISLQEQYPYDTAPLNTSPFFTHLKLYFKKWMKCQQLQRW